jgi:hypothetical protein
VLQVVFVKERVVIPRCFGLSIVTCFCLNKSGGGICLSDLVAAVVDPFLPIAGETKQSDGQNSGEVVDSWNRAVSAARPHLHLQA